MNLARHSRNQKTKNKSPRTHLSQVWSPAFRLPWVRSRLKPELRTSPQRRGEREGRPWERTLPACLRFRDYYQSTQDACAPRRTPENALFFCKKDFVASSCLRGETFFGCGFAALCSSVFIRGFVLCEVWAENVKFSIDCVPVPRVG